MLCNVAVSGELSFGHLPVQDNLVAARASPYTEERNS